VIVASGPSAVAVKGATSTIPIVFSSGADPVGQGLVASLSRPGGNATGVAVFTNELGPKRLELLRELVPKAELIAFVVGTTAQAKEVQTGVWTENLGGECLHTRRGRTGFRNHRAGKSWRYIVQRAPVLPSSAGSARGARCTAPTTSDVRMARVCRSGRPRQLQHQPQRLVSPNGSLHRTDSQRC
jgi:ABC transporter substrate binding protein